MNKQTPWQRLHKIVEDRIDQLGLTRDGIHARGGPSSEWIRGLKNRTGKATVRQTASLFDLDAVMGWNSGTSRSLINDDRSKWSKKMLDAEAYDLVFTNLPAPAIAPEQNGLLSKSERDIRTMQTAVAAALRAMDGPARRKAMQDIAALLGI
jgi:hypothetical protein